MGAYKCFVIGEGALLLQSLKILQQGDFIILGAISGDKEVVRWAQQNRFPVYHPGSDIYDIFSKEPFDYLFSIVNPAILPARILTLPTKHAINYHDAPLPRYAGVNATSWALINQEKEHGVTWHVMAEKVDAGEILKQVCFSIEPDETAFTLNVKCFDTAIASFRELVGELVAGVVKPVSQDQAQRSFFPSNKRPLFSAVIQWHKPAEEINALYRGLYFAHYPNPISLPKLVLGQELYVIDELAVDNEATADAPGSLIKCSNEGLTVATSTNNVVIKGIASLDGVPRPLCEVISQHQLQIGQVLPAIDERTAGEIDALNKEFALQEPFWKKHLEEVQPVDFLFLDKPALSASARPVQILSIPLTKKAYSFFIQQNYCPQQVLVTLFAIYLSRLNRMERFDLAFTSAELTRKIQYAKDFFAPEVPFRIDLNSDMSFEKAYQYLFQQLQRMSRHQTYARDLIARTPALQPLHGLLKLISTSVAVREVNSLDEEASLGKASLSLLLGGLQVDDVKWGVLAYDPGRIEGDTVARIAGHLEALLESVLKKPAQPISRLNILPAAERDLLLYEFNGTQADYPQEKTIIDLFEEQVERTPDNIAVVFDPDSDRDRELTYRELNERANRVGHYLRDKYDIRPDDVVALQLERSEWMVVAILGVLKSGAAYLPIDPFFPNSRVRYILQDSQAKLLLADKESFAPVQELSGVLPILNVEQIKTNQAGNPGRVNQPHDLAYVIYTSGSSGQPKGVTVGHAGLVNVVQKPMELFAVTPSDRILQFFNYTFDTSVIEIFLALFTGMAVVIPKTTKLSIEQFVEVVKNNQVTILSLPPKFLNALAGADLGGARILALGGESPDISVLKHYTQKYRCFNAYGVTEASVDSTWYEVPEDWNKANIPIGRPLPNIEVYILNEEIGLVPIGLAGEMCIGGIGLARGYLNNPELTAEKFIPHPFRKGERLYRTGDLARWLPDGNLEFLGRIDHQLKIRGYRIEAGEVEQALLEHPSVRSAVVEGREMGQGKELIAYLVAGEDGLAGTEELRRHLSDRLPGYMIPSYFVELEALPLTTSGKVDRKALPAPDVDSITSGAVYVAPRNVQEQTLADIWKAVLHREAVGIHDNFFHIGGDSIKAIQITARLAGRQLSLPIRDLLAQPTIAQLAPLMEPLKKSYPQGIQEGELPLTPIQRWFFREYLVDRHHFNQSFRFRATERLSEAALRQALQGLLTHHDLLRSVYIEENGRAIQRTEARMELDLSVMDLRSGSGDEESRIEEVANEAQAGFNLSAGPLLKAGLIKRAEGDELLLVIHHLVVDGVSWRILLEDLDHCYTRCLAVRPIQLPAKTAPFAMWAGGLEEYARSARLLAEAAYWREMTGRPVSALPVSRPEGSNLSEDTAGVSFELDEAQTQQLTSGIHHAYHTEINDVLLTALSRALRATFGGDSYAVTLEGRGREDIGGLDVSRTVGWFTSVFPHVLTYEEEVGLHLQQAKEGLRRIPKKGVGYGILRYMSEADPGEDKAQVIFNYLGEFSEGESQGTFRYSQGSTGLSHSPRAARHHELDVSGMIQQDKLRLSVRYSAERMDKAQLEALMAAYKSALEEIIAHCSVRRSSLYTPSDFTGCDWTLSQYRQFLEANGLAAEQVADIYPLSPLQEGMLFHKLMDAESAAYFVQLALRLEGQVDIGRFKESWRRLIQRHSVLRTSFFTDGLERPVQVVRKAVELPFRYRDISHLSEERQEQEINQFLAEDRARGFGLKEESLLRLTLFKLGERAHRLVISNHHIILDGWSGPVLMQEWQELYAGKALDGEVAYAPFIAWLEAKGEEAPAAFWRDYLAGYEGKSSIPMLKEGLPDSYREGQDKTWALSLSEAHTRGLEQLAARLGVSLNTVIQGIWAAILGRYNQRDEVVFGMTTSGRAAGIANIERLTGLFINTIPVRIRLEAESSFRELFGQIHADSLRMREHEHYSLARIQAGWLGGGELFDHIGVFENYPVAEKVGKWELNIQQVQGYERTHYGFGLAVVPGRRLNIRLHYHTGSLSGAMAERIGGHIEEAIKSVLANPDQPISRLNVLPPAERDLLLYEFNDTQTEYPQDKTMVELFEEQVERTPNNIAVVFDPDSDRDRELTYRELNEQANRVGHYLRATYDIQPDDVVALQLERSEWMVVAILGVLKSGAAYLPIDPQLPSSRVAYMLEDSRAKALLVDAATFESAMEFRSTLPVVKVEEVDFGRTDNPGRIATSRSLAYIIYTSGSTGRPKGVMLEHRGAANMSLSQIEQYELSESDRVLQFIAYTFDASIGELFIALLSGATLVVADKHSLHTPNLFLPFVKRHEITVLTLLPVFLSSFKKAGLEGVRVLITGGEKPSLSDALYYSSCLRYFNAYGPTECSVCSSLFEVPQKWEAPYIPIGKPISNAEAFILNQEHQLLPVGIAGELCVSGIGLARGYLNNPELTAEKFIPHPFLEGERLYRTGDLARWLPDGNLEFLGRIDHQLKIRGYRIEAGEVEQALLEHPAIKSAVVEGREFRQGKELIAYLVAGKGGLPDMGELRRHLSERLPGYMIPSYFVELEALPLTTSGKVDRKALPAPDAGSLAAGAAYVAPRNSTEVGLLEIWEEVLQRSGIGVHDNFFELGGHSLKAIQLNAKMISTFNLPIPLYLIYQHPNIAALAAKIGASGEYHHQNGILYNPEAGQTVFAFPLFFGLAVSYQPLAALFPETAWYCFDFLEADNRLELYYEQVKKHQPEGPYVFFGHSAGGNLAFEMARYLQSRGEEVSGLIFGDSVVHLEKTSFDFKEYAARIGVHGEAGVWGRMWSILLQNEIARKQAESRMTAYHHFLNHQAMDTPVRADIYLLEAQAGDEQDGSMFSRDWRPYTSGRFSVYAAQGAHDALFEPPNLAPNAGMIRRILSVIREGGSAAPYPSLSLENGIDPILELGQLTTEHFERGGTPFNFNLEGYRETYPEKVAAIEAFIRRQTAAVPSGEGELPTLAEENRALFARLLRLQQEMEQMRN